MEFVFEKLGKVGIFTFTGELTQDNEDNLKMVLMKAIHSIDRAVLNFKKVKGIDLKCLNLIKQAYLTSVRLKNPLILTNVPERYLSELFRKERDHYLAVKDHDKVTEEFTYN